METINQTVARSVLRLCKETGFSQLMLATEARTALKTLHAAERAAGNLRLSTLEKMVGAFGIPAAQLFEQKRSAPRLNALIELLTSPRSMKKGGRILRATDSKSQHDLMKWREGFVYFNFWGAPCDGVCLIPHEMGGLAKHWPCRMEQRTPKERGRR